MEKHHRFCNYEPSNLALVLKCREWIAETDDMPDIIYRIYHLE